jgi:hypothetical protein
MGAVTHQSPLAKAIQRALTRPSAGLTSVRRHVRTQVARWQSEGVAEAEILAALMSIAAQVARETGSDRIDLLTGEPRWRFVEDAIRMTVRDCAPSSLGAQLATDRDAPARDDRGAAAREGLGERYAKAAVR